MKGTKLWQETRSPLISGRSRSARPFGSDVGASCVATAAGWGIVLAAIGLARGDLAGPFASLGLSVVLAPAVGGLVGCTTGVWFLRAWGTRRPWLGGAAVGLVLGAAAAAISVGTIRP